jgi:hypothetical protein
MSLCSQRCARIAVVVMQRAWRPVRLVSVCSQRCNSCNQRRTHSAGVAIHELVVGCVTDFSDSPVVACGVFTFAPKHVHLAVSRFAGLTVHRSIHFRVIVVIISTVRLTGGVPRVCACCTVVDDGLACVFRFIVGVPVFTAHAVAGRRIIVDYFVCFDTLS